MPKTKLDKFTEVKTNKKHKVTLAEIPDLPLSLTIEQAAGVAGVGYHEIRRKIELGEIFAIEVGEADKKKKRLIPTFEFLTSNHLCSESLLEKILLQRMEWERQDRENRLLSAVNE